VLTELTARDVAALSPSQRSNRARPTLTLANYRDRGIFPHNYDFADRAMPYFIDRKTGTLCAVAYLLESTGRRDIVDRVARENNDVWVGELAADTALASWLDANGITLDEAARSQVPYVQPVSKAEEARNVTFVALAPVALVTSLATTIWNGSTNTDGHRRGVSWTGVVSSGLTLTAGALVLKMADGDGGIREAGMGAVALGGLGLFTATHAIKTHNRIARVERENEERRRMAEASLSPLVTGSLNHPGVGATLSVRS
jgi:hypothetical protein